MEEKPRKSRDGRTVVPSTTRFVAGFSSPSPRYLLRRLRYTMAIHDIVSDPSLQPVLNTTADTLEQCHRLLSLLDPTSASSTSDPQGTSLVATKQQKHLFAQLAQLRGQSRDAIFRIRETKQLTAEGRQEIDRLHLQLQNLYYEQRHLAGEISACESYEYVC